MPCNRLQSVERRARNIAVPLAAFTAIIGFSGCERRQPPPPPVEEVVDAPAPEPPPPPPAIGELSIEVTLAVSLAPVPIAEPTQVDESEWAGYEEGGPPQPASQPEPPRDAFSAGFPRLATGIALDFGSGSDIRFSDDGARPKYRFEEDVGVYHLTLRYLPFEGSGLVGGPVSRLREMEAVEVRIEPVLRRLGLEYRGVERITLNMNGSTRTLYAADKHADRTATRFPVTQAAEY